VLSRSCIEQDVEKVRPRRSRKTLPPHRLGGVQKCDARDSPRREPQRLTVRRTAFLRILRVSVKPTGRISRSYALRINQTISQPVRV
jgi:hypothetical protein